jgi:hypothetical protein
MGNPIEDRVEWWLEEYIVHPEDYWSSLMDRRFVCERINKHLYLVTDNALDLKTYLPRTTVLQWHWNPARWYRQRLGKAYLQLHNDLLATNYGQYEGLTELFPLLEPPPTSQTMDRSAVAKPVCHVVPYATQHTPIIFEDAAVHQEGQALWLDLTPPVKPNTECAMYGVQVVQGKYPALQRNSVVTRDVARAIPKPVVVVVHVNGRPARALIDTGSLADFISLTTVEQLKCRLTILGKPLTIQLAVQGSRLKVNYGTTVWFQYQGTDYQRYFDVINLQNYDLILGTLFLYQHSVTVGLNPPRVVLECIHPLALKGDGITTLESRAAEIVRDNIAKTREILRQLASPLCAKAADTSLPPLRAINHTIPLMDKSKIYPWRPSQCPEPMRPQWAEKQ